MNKNLTKNILMGLFLTGAIMIAATSPYFLTNIAKAYLKNKKYGDKNPNRRKIAQAFSYLKRNGLIILKEDDGKITVELTENGKRKIKQYQFEELSIAKPKNWDKKWRIVIFDIPEKRKKMAREAFRGKLKILNFFQLQESVWVHPYPCENEIQLAAEIFMVTPFINIIIADRILNDVKARAHFNLL